MENLKKYIQYQKPMAAMLIGLGFPAVFAVYNFGLRVFVSLLIANLICWACEYYFTRQNNKPSSMAAFVTGTLIVLVCPPSLPFWMLIVACVFAIVFAKMTFGGFGKNIFNPAIAGRCFLYVCFPIAMTGVWNGPADGALGGFTQWLSGNEVKEYNHPDEVISGATILAGSKVINNDIKNAASLRKSAAGDEKETFQRQIKEDIKAVEDLNFVKVLTGRISGSAGETSAIAILIALGYLLYKKAVAPALVISPLVGLWLTTVVLSLAGVNQLPLFNTLYLNTFAGGTLFAVVFMTTEPVSAPMNNKARWIYGISIGFFATIIRAMSVFNAGFMFSILLGNMFGPIIEIAVKGYEDWKKSRGNS